MSEHSEMQERVAAALDGVGYGQIKYSLGQGGWPAVTKELLAALAADGLTITTTEAAETGEAVLRLEDGISLMRMRPYQDGRPRWRASTFVALGDTPMTGFGDSPGAAIDAALTPEAPTDE